MDAIPAALQPLITALETVPNLSRKDLISVVFVVRLGDLLHRSFYGTFLTQSLVHKLCEKLGIPGLLVEVDVFVMRWSFREGTVSVAHRILWDYDMYSVSVLTKIGRGVLNGSVTPKEGLRLIRDHEQNTCYCRLETCYRDFPGRSLIIPLMAGTIAVVFFGGTWYDLGFASLCGLAAGLVAWIGSLHEQLWGIMDYMAAIFAAMISVAAITVYPDSACFSAEIIGTLYWFLYGTAYVLSLYEITNNQLMTGVTRFMFAILRSYGLAFASMVGVWLSFYGGPDRLDAASVDCSTKSHQISDIWLILFFPLAAISCLMQFRVGLNDFVVCLIVQAIAFGTQYVIGTVWKQPDFLANMIPAYLITIMSHFIIYVMHRFELSGLEVSKSAYIEMKMINNNILDNLDSGREEVHESQQDEEQSAEKADPLQPNNGLHDLDTENCDNELEDNYDGSEDEMISFVSEGWAKSKNAVGYIPGDSLSYARSDAWFCLLPALYLLVPGAKVLESAVTNLMSAISGGDGAFDRLADSFFLIGLSQVIGLRLGFATLFVCSKIGAWMCDRGHCGRSVRQSEDKRDVSANSHE